MKSIWLTGSNSHLGKILMPILHNLKDSNGANYLIYATDIDECDITNEQAVEQFVNLYTPQFIINCAAITDPDVCENDPDLAYKVNAIAVRNIAIQAQKIKSLLIHFSSDDVFSNSNLERVNEFDTPNTESIYGKSKLAGEKIIQNFMTRFIIIRSSWVYDLNYGFVSKILNSINNNIDIYVSDQGKAIPTSTIQIAEIFKQLLNGNHYGIFHTVASGEPCSRYELAKEIYDILGANLTKLHKTNDVNSKVVLDNMMMRLSEIKPLSLWKDELRRIILRNDK